MGSSNEGIHLYNVSGITINAVQIDCPTFAILQQYTSQVTVKNCMIFMHNSNGNYNVPVVAELYGPGWNGLYYKNN